MGVYRICKSGARHYYLWVATSTCGGFDITSLSCEPTSQLQTYGTVGWAAGSVPA